MRPSPRIAGAALVAGASLTIALAAAPASAATTFVFTPPPATSNIPALTGFATSGDMMGGMLVRVDFVNGIFDEAIWTGTGAGAGGALGTGWQLTEVGDTFVGIDQQIPSPPTGSDPPTAGIWDFKITGDGGQLQVRRLTLSGNPGFTVFDVDTYDPSCAYTGNLPDTECTSGSGRGSRLRFVDPDINAEVTYLDPVEVAGAGALGDLFHVLQIDFLDNGIRDDAGAVINGLRGGFYFVQDTDNDARSSNGVPEPGTLALLGLGLAGLAAGRRRG